MPVSTWELHFEPKMVSEQQFMVARLNDIATHFPDQLEHTTDGDGLHVMVDCLQIMMMVLGMFEHTINPKSISVQVNDDLKTVGGSIPLFMEVELPWYSPDLELASIKLSPTKG